MDFPAGLKYTKEHEWVRVEGDLVYVGITDYAQHALGDVVFLELPEAGTQVKSGETFGVVESVKAVSDLYAPLSGTVAEINAPLVDTPELINEDPYGEGWMIAVKGAPADDLMDAAAYEAYVKEIA